MSLVNDETPEISAEKLKPVNMNDKLNDSASLDSMKIIDTFADRVKPFKYRGFLLILSDNAPRGLWDFERSSYYR